MPYFKHPDVDPAIFQSLSPSHFIYDHHPCFPSSTASPFSDSTAFPMSFDPHSNSASSSDFSSSSSLPQPPSPPSPPYPPPLQPPKPPQGRPVRNHHHPSYLKDFVCNTVSQHQSISSCPHTVTSLCIPSHSCFTTRSTLNQQFLHSVAQIQEPSCYEESVLHPSWQEAMEKEFDALNATHNWDITELPKGKKPISST